MPSPIVVTLSGCGAARNRIVLADDVAIADSQIAALAGEVLVERIGPQHRTGRDLVALAEGGPALHENVRFQAAERSDHHVLFDDRELADAGLRPDARLRMNARGGGHGGRRINWHKFVA